MAPFALYLILLTNRDLKHPKRRTLRTGAGSERAIYTTSNAAAALGEFDIGQLNGFPKSKVKLLEAAKIIVFCFPALYHKK